MATTTRRTDDYVVDFPVLWVALDWIEQHCVVPDGFDRGKPFVPARWQSWFFANFYRVRSGFEMPGPNPVGAPAFYYRRGQCVMPQKAGKGPMTAAHICLEGAGPAMFAGWALGGEVYDCRDHGCGCGWEYEYDPGEPMGEPWPTPLIQPTAFSKEQVGNVYDALRPMIEHGPLAALIPKTGEELIRLPGGGRIDVVTSSQQSRLGQRVTFVPQDETGIWTETNKMTNVAKTQRRGAAGMQGRTTETTNAWDPTENSVAQQTAMAALQRPDIFRLHPLAPPKGDGFPLSFTNKAERMRILKYVYRDCPWIDLATINAEAEELLLLDPGNAERFYGNRIVAGHGAWLEDGLWDSAERVSLVPEGAEIALGFDGSESDDWTAIRAETRDGFIFTPRYGPSRRPTFWNPKEWGGSIPRGEVHAAVDELFRRYRPKKFYCDPRDWQSEIGEWALRYGEEIVLEWATYRPVAMHDALNRTYVDLKTGRLTHDPDPVTAEHVGNARKLAKPQERYILGKPDQHRKIDLAMASVLAHEAASDWREEPEEKKGLTRVHGRARVS
jgi:hypothetical protein